MTLGQYMDELKEESLEKGREEGKLEVIESMIMAGIDKRIIVKITNMSEAEVEDMAKRVDK